MRLWQRILALIGLHSVSSVATAAQPPLEYQLWHAGHVIVVWQQGNSQYSSYQLDQVLKGDINFISLREEPALDVDDSTWQLLGNVPAPGNKAVMFLVKAEVTPPGHDITGLYPLDEQNNFTYAVEDHSVSRTLNIAQLAEILNQPPFNLQSCSMAEQIANYLLCTDKTRRGRLFHHGMEITGKHDGQIVTADPPDDKPLFIYRDPGKNNAGSVAGWKRAGNF